VVKRLVERAVLRVPARGAAVQLGVVEAGALALLVEELAQQRVHAVPSAPLILKGEQQVVARELR
jgi:hypothetical protein